jgi:hypothetical protein
MILRWFHLPQFLMVFVVRPLYFKIFSVISLSHVIVVIVIMMMIIIIVMILEFPQLLKFFGGEGGQGAREDVDEHKLFILI